LKAGQNVGRIDLEHPLVIQFGPIGHFELGVDAREHPERHDVPGVRRQDAFEVLDRGREVLAPGGLDRPCQRFAHIGELIS
jgi:hypothetical protein